jgi:hypothetical protein
MYFKKIIQVQLFFQPFFPQVHCLLGYNFLFQLVDYLQKLQKYEYLKVQSVLSLSRFEDHFK